MAVSQWTISNAGGINWTLSNTSPIAGSSSLSIFRGGDGPIVFGLTTGANIDTGKVRTIIRPRTGNATDRQPGVFGMMQSSIAHNSNTYRAQLGQSASVSTTQVGLFKGQPFGTESLLVLASSGLTYAVGSTFTLQLQWQRDPGSGIVILTVSTGTATNFSDLTTRITYSDNSSPYSSGVSAGIVHRAGSGAGAGADEYFDETSIFRV